MKEKIILIGAGGHARSCIDVIEAEDKYSIFGLIGSKEEVGTKILGYEVLGTDEDLVLWKRKCKNAIVTIGQIKNPEPRIRLYHQLKKFAFHLPVIVSPNAYVSKYSSIGEGSIIMHQVMVNSNVKIGANCIINSKALLEHDVTIGDYCHISTSSVLNGETSIGDASFIGSGSVVKETIKIGSNCVIAMASRVIRDVPNHTQYKTSI
ncbi:acetyltransferase [Leptospira yasudae]|uniref:Acetyltransferase n=1 Tax=Leptospira yasudae TaxID=2202201 RepID=A0ABX9LZB2_9LEPT|nr:acetyltransferase [Leptospira yasudae]RHX78281.1 acetyltransferase [Leptospira yasudae]TGK24505.1 acetyltransferase [Leptospira yasudae]TGM05709.1 acetyltransferase [Leptospira yasudae]